MSGRPGAPGRTSRFVDAIRPRTKQGLGLYDWTVSLPQSMARSFFGKLLRVKNRRTVAVRLLLCNRLWVIANRTLFVRSSGSSAPGVAATDWVYRRVFAGRQVTNPRVMALVVDLGRLGNALSRISKGVVTAREQHWTGVIIPRLSHFPAYAPLIGRESVRVNGFVATCGDDRWGLGESPDLIVRREFHHEPIEPDAKTRAMVKNVVGSLFSGLRREEELTAKDLVVHVRSGDIYFREGVGNWGQPPAAYYEKIIREEPWSRVFVVCEDNESPVLRPIAALCESLGIEHVFQSGTLAEDLALLARATNLVVGRGTFAPAVVLLNMALEKVVFFEDRFDSKFVDPSTELVRVVDEQGTYRESVLQGRWVNSEEQRELMVSYPMSALGFEGKRS